MRLATIRTAHGTVAARMDSDTNATVISGFADVGALLADDQWRHLAASADSDPIEVSREDFAPVIPRPGKIICVGLNYAKHIREMGHAQPDVPTLFIKFPEALIGAADDIQVPGFASEKADFEGELAVVVGKQARNVADGNDYIAGYTVINDFTMRDFQYQTQQWHQGKSFERTAGFGPWIDTDFEPGPVLTTRVNGEIMQQDSTGDLIFTPAQLIEFISRIYTLQPGDVIATGTPEGVGHGRGIYLKDGDVVEIAVEGIGAIRNTVRVTEARTS